MSYLNAVRLHFAGRFRADVSTINNDDTHFDETTFVPADQLPQTSTDMRGWWQPAGTGAWRLSGCTVTGASGPDGPLMTAPADDGVIGLSVRNSGDRVDAKMVDLDPDQQAVSMIFGLEIRIVDPATGIVLMAGEFTPVAFMDLWPRCVARGGSGGLSAYYQSTLENVVWGDLSASPMLQSLQAATLPGRLSVTFIVDLYESGGIRRGFGRIVGTIGPQLGGEPAHFVAGRHLGTPGGPAFGPVTCSVDSTGGQLFADFGNALPVDATGTAIDQGDLHLVAFDPAAATLDAAHMVDLGSLVGYTAPGYYEKTAGIQLFPPDRRLKRQEQQQVAGWPLAVMVKAASGAWSAPLATEASSGVFVRPDGFVLRINPGETKTLPILATQFGQPFAGQTVEPTVSANSIGRTSGGTPPVAVPVDALDIAVAGPTGLDGWTSMSVTGSDPGTPRDYIDGQVYEIDLGLRGVPGAGTAFDPMMFVSVLLFSHTEVPETVDWHGDVLPILQQYANLYPRPHGPDRYVPYAAQPPLHPVVSLADPVWVAAFAPRILAALALPIEHPNHMPVTRDLSAGRRGILRRWMQQMIVDGLPPDLATPPPGAPPPPARATAPRRLQGAEAPARAMDPRLVELLARKSGASVDGDANGEDGDALR